MSKTPWSSVGYLTFKRTYARPLEGGQTEEFDQAIARVLAACDEQLGCGFSNKDEEDLFDILHQLKGSVAGRFWWTLGTRTVADLGLLSLQNCAFTVIDHPVEPFCWAMDALMLGSGVGYSIQREHISKLPKVKKNFKPCVRQDNASADFIVPDSREGWVALLRKTLESAFKGKSPAGFTYSVQLVRSAGAPIKGFGGTASGPEILVTGIDQICAVLDARKGTHLRPIDALDIMNIIGSIVVAGNVRRSAQIAIGDSDDEEYLNAKRWDLGDIPYWRAMSNNSVVWDGVTELSDSFWAGYSGHGEPYGLINLELSRREGRLGDTSYPDPDVQGFNPCAEQSLADKETCALAELYLPNIESAKELDRTIELLYKIVKHSLRLPCHLKQTEAIVHKNMRMGIGVTGYVQATEEQRSWLPAAYERLRALDKEYSALKGWPQSIKLTTVKPSGTLSLLPGVTSGAHFAYARHMIRRIRIASNHPLVKTCRDHGYHVEPARRFDGTEDHSTMVVEFPFEHRGYEGRTADEVSALEQLAVVKRLQSDWSDNAVSCTITYQLDELEAIKAYLRASFKDNHKSLSFLLHSGHGFAQAPIEPISEAQFNELVARTELITSVSAATELGLDEAECVAGVCPIR